jgi:ATP-dependent Clp protease adapter protein ClpS
MEVSTKTQLKLPSKYEVVVEKTSSNDLSQFSEILKDIFNHDAEHTVQLMSDLLQNGKITAGKYNYEIAEQKALEAYSIAKLKKIDLNIDIKSL